MENAESGMFVCGIAGTRYSGMWAAGRRYTGIYSEMNEVTKRVCLVYIDIFFNGNIKLTL